MKQNIKIVLIALLVIFISAIPSKAQKAGPDATNKQAKSELKAERKRENIRRKRAEDSKEMNNPKIIGNRKLSKRSKKKDPKSEREQNKSAATTEVKEEKPQYANDPPR
ncbi:MAG: hypothetical protein ACT4ON_08775 [Bacteroidota bacterium]